MPVPAAAWQPRISSCINIASWIRAAAAYSVPYVTGPSRWGGMPVCGEREHITYLGVTLCRDTRVSLLCLYTLALASLILTGEAKK